MLWALLKRHPPHIGGGQPQTVTGPPRAPSARPAGNQPSLSLRKARCFRETPMSRYRTWDWGTSSRNTRLIVLQAGAWAQEAARFISRVSSSRNSKTMRPEPERSHTMNRVAARSCHLAFIVLAWFSGAAQSAPLNLADQPLIVGQTAPPLTMLIMGRDHKLYYEAYNDASDLDGDGELDIRYKPDSIDYFGYFNSYACYDYDATEKLFVPKSVKNATQIAARDKTCAGGSEGEWSGDFLNYLTTARIDALRKVLYGGYREIDTTERTVLRRTHIPQDAHAWGKAYNSPDIDGYDIADYTPLTQPRSGRRHLFANVSRSGNGPPLLRVMQNAQWQIWEWVSIERPVAGDKCKKGNGPLCIANGKADSLSDFEVRVEVCRVGLLEPNCKLYPSGYAKPTGILHQYGETGRMHFGLLSGSYDNNTDGGILRRNIGPFVPEVNVSDGTFTTNVSGIVRTLDALKVKGFSYSGYKYSCGWIANRPINNGECVMWGNPVAEMLYESTRYFAGKKTPTSAYIAKGNTQDAALGLPDLSNAWLDPYDVANGGYPHCAKPFQIVISDINPSYDSDNLPGSQFNSAFTGDLPGLDVTREGDTISVNEADVVGKHFIGESYTAGGSVHEKDSAGKPKQVDSLGRIRGLAPEEPTKLGSYYSASVAYWAFMNDVHAVATGQQRVQTFAVALASPLPQVRIPVDNGRWITLVPFAKSVGGYGISSSETAFQPTNQIVDFYVEYLKPDEGRFRINFEDVEQGADHDMDAIATYTYKKNNDGTLTVSISSDYAAGSIDQHMGYIISGTTADGIYLEVRDLKDGETSDNPAANSRLRNYFMDTNLQDCPKDGDPDHKCLPLTASRTFTPGSSTGATLLKNPLWYAAKWGGFQDANGNGVPEGTEWDADGDGNPDNYFPVTNANNLGPQLEKAFNEILARNASSAAVTVNSGELTNGALLFRAEFDSGNWTGSLKALPVQSDGTLSSPAWNAREKLDALVAGTGYRDNRVVITARSDNERGVPFRWPSSWKSDGSWTPASTDLTLDQTLAWVAGVPSGQDQYGADLVAYLRGDQSEELGQAGSTLQFRQRDHILGDIIHSDPLYVAAPAFFYPDDWPGTAPEDGGQKYSDFQSEMKNRSPMLYFGANDGMLHGIVATENGQGGKEKLAFIPEAVFDRLPVLANASYSHQYFVDGKLTAADAWLEEDEKWHTLLVGGLGKGGQAFFALDITDPDGLSTARGLGFSEGNAAKLVRWQFDDSDDADLGYTYGKASVVRMANGKWAAVFGNGYNNTASDDHVSATGNAVLYVVDIQTGALIRKFDTQQGMAQDPEGQGRPNGMAAPMVVDLNNDLIADVIYAGDLFGHVWKVDVSDANASNWDFALFSGGKPAPLFKAVSASGAVQPITTQVRVGRHPNYRSGNNVLVYVGTGKFLEPDDVTVSASTVTQSFYAIWDKGTANVGRINLQRQSILKETTQSGRAYRVLSQNPVDWNSKLGWYMDFIKPSSTDNQGERVVYTPLIRNGRIILSTLIPSGDSCEGGGSGWVMELDAATGGQLDYSPVDVNKDGQFNNDDKLDTDGDGQGDAWTSGFQPEDGGIPTPPAVLEDPSTYNTDHPREYKYTGTSKGKVDTITEKNNPWSNSRYAWREVH
ncbi:MAG: fimbrial assembly protein [Gammaproteobacteria bacterium]|nr:MAG: fimbrial assembly protein [Gammaproteobacteria bacterium]